MTVHRHENSHIQTTVQYGADDDAESVGAVSFDLVWNA